MRVNSGAPQKSSAKSPAKAKIWPDGATHEYSNPVGGRVRFVRIIRRGEAYSIITMWMEDKKRWKSSTDTVENTCLKIIGL
jgi:hypothetical protein